MRRGWDRADPSRPDDAIYAALNPSCRRIDSLSFDSELSQVDVRAAGVHY